MEKNMENEMETAISIYIYIYIDSVDSVDPGIIMTQPSPTLARHVPSIASSSYAAHVSDQEEENADLASTGRMLHLSSAQITPVLTIRVPVLQHSGLGIPCCRKKTDFVPKICSLHMAQGLLKHTPR